VGVFWALAGLGLALPWACERWGSAATWTPTATLTCSVSSVHDGDTLRAECDDGQRMQVRFNCIDAPELAQAPFGLESRDHLRALTPKRVELRVKDVDRYGRKVAEVLDPSDPSRSLNLRQVEDGQAAVYRRYCSDPRYSAAEDRARSAGLGIWERPGEQQTPWDYRHRGR
jgi:endonuclease YncB( thermonuclease family)